MWFRLAIKDTNFESYIEKDSEEKLLEKWYDFASYYLNKEWIYEMIEKSGAEFPPLAIVETVEKPSAEWLLYVIGRETECAEKHVEYANKLQSLLATL